MENINTDYTSSSPSNSFSLQSESSSSSLSSITDLNWTTWIIIILILAFLGFNIFAYLAQGTQEISDVFAPITKKLFGTTVAVSSEIVDVSAEGAKAVVTDSSNVINKGLTELQQITPNNAVGQQQQQQAQMTKQALDQGHEQGQGQDQDYQAHEATSSVHSSGKAGWCYIGEDRGFRACAQVSANDTCMSGDIFPSQEICMNPSLRQ
jgi:hypothetical protein